jgi:putative lipoprotein
MSRRERGARLGSALLGASLLALALLGVPRPALADPPSPSPTPLTGGALTSPDPDPWFGRDKALHFAGSFAISTGGYALGVATLDKRWVGLLFGGGISLSLGALKEGLDAAGLGTPSWRDFAWDCLGTMLGLGVSVTFDAALRGPGH